MGEVKDGYRSHSNDLCHCSRFSSHLENSLMGVFHSPPLPSGQEAYIEALSELSSLVCEGSEELKRIEQQAIREPLNKDIADEMFHLRAELIRKYVQTQLRGGLN